MDDIEFPVNLPEEGIPDGAFALIGSRGTFTVFRPCRTCHSLVSLSDDFRHELWHREHDKK